MKILLFGIALLSMNLAVCQNSSSKLKMESQYSSDNKDLKDILSFEGIEYLKVRFTGSELPNKTYKLTVKEIWDGKTVRDTSVFDSNTMPIDQLKKVNDTVLVFRIVAKHTDENKLKMTFNFPRVSVNKVFDATNSNDYSLRNIAQESGLDISYDKKFYLLAYILPYEHADGGKSWCDVGTDGKDLENWGKKFGIKHYLLFEMLLE